MFRITSLRPNKNEKRFPFWMLIFLSLISNVTFAQSNFSLTRTPGTTNFTASMQDYFSGLDLTQVPHEVLHDYGLPLLDTRFFDGTSINQTNLVHNYDIWKYGYGAISLGQVNGNSSFQNHIQVFDGLRNHFSQTNRYPLVVLLANYGKIKDDAVANNLIYEQNEVLYDSPGRTVSPYESHQVFMASITNTRAVYTNVVPVEFKSEWFYSNVMGFESMLVDFGDGNGQVLVTNGYETEITYPDTGTYTITYQIITNSGTLSAHSSIRIARLQPVIDLNIPIDPTNLHSGVQTQVRFGCGRTRLMKPLIFVQGFEFTGLFDQEFDVEYAFRKINDWQNLQGFFQNYDLVFIKFNDPQDDLHRNAQALIDAITKINALKEQNGSNEPNLMIGESMGGLIARLALHSMEQQQLTNPNIKHDCDRLILLDSPHQGANVPLAFQAMVDEVGNSILYDILSPIRDAVRTLQSTAAQQMLIYHINHPGVNSVHTELMAALQNANPQQCRVIGISNGVDNGNGQGFQPGDAFVDQVYLFTPNAVGSKNWLLGLLTAIVPVHFEFILLMKSAPNYPSTPTLLYQTEASISLLWGLRKIHLIRPSLGIVVNMYPYDSAPGGFEPVESGIPFLDKNIIELDQFGYIPTPSGLNMAGHMQMTAPYFDFNGINIANPLNGGNGWSTFDEAIREDQISIGNWENRKHIRITTLNSVDIANAMLDWNNTGAFTPNATIGNSTFNYGETPAGVKTNIWHTTNTTVGNSGILCVNCNTQVGRSTLLSQGDASTPSFGVGFVRPCNTAGTITIEIGNTGSFVLGSSGNQASKSHFGPNTQLIIRSGGTLTINENSALFIDAGARLVLEAGAIINLNGSNAVLDIGGNLDLPNTAGYVFQHSGNGYLRFRNPVISAPFPVQFRFVGSGISDKIVEIADQTVLNLPSNVTELRLENGLVQLGAGTIVDLNTKLVLQNAMVSGTPIASYTRFSISAKPGTVIHNVSFQYGARGLTLGGLATSSPLITNCTFSNNAHGLFVGTTAHASVVKNSTFSNNVFIGILGQGLNNPVIIENCNIQGSQHGISLHSWNMTQMEIKNSTIQASHIGVNLFGGNTNISETNITGVGISNNSTGLSVAGNAVVRPRCVNISNFHVGADLSTNCHLNLASGSTSNFTNNSIGVFADDAFLSIQNASSRLDANSLYSIFGKLKPSPEFQKQQLTHNSESFVFFKWPVHRLKMNPQPYPAINNQGVLINTASPFRTNDFTMVNGTITQVNQNVELPIFVDCINCNLIFACETVSEPPYYSEWILDPANNANGRIVFTSYFPGVEYVSALRSALDNITFVPDNQVNDLLAVLQLKQLLSLNLSNITETEHLARLAASKYMGMALGNAYAYGQLAAKNIHSPGALTEEELFLINLLESQKNGVLETDAELVIAQAQVYRLAAHYQTAIDLINSTEASYATNNKQGYWSCLLPLEFNYLKGEIELDEFLQASTDCGNQWQMRKMPYPTKNENPVQLSNTDEKLKLMVFPNPGNTSFELKVANFTSNESFKLVITDNFGRILLSQPYKNGDITSTEGWPSGAYQISIQSNQSKLHTLWIKQ
jgi:parallel beta-helix repeat protein